MNTNLPALFNRYIILKKLQTGMLLLCLSLVSANAIAIDAPRDPRGTVVRAGEIKWEWSAVSDAVRYQVNVNGVYAASTSNLYYYSKGLNPGNYTFTVQAIHSDGSYSSPSATSEPRTIDSVASNTTNSNNDSVTARNAGTSSLTAPRDPRGTLVRPAEIKWEWASVSGAQRYEVFVDSASIGFTTDLFVYTKNLSPGQHTMTVRAVDSDGNQSNDSAVATRSVNNDGSVTPSSTNEADSQSASNDTSNSSLSTPRDPRGTRVRPAEIKWEWAEVSGAVEYEVTVDGNSQRTAVVYLYTKNLSVGEHTMTVRAVDSNGQLSAASSQAKASTWEGSTNTASSNSNATSQGSQSATSSSIGEPRDVRGTQVRPGEVKWEWSRVLGASEYVVYLDGSLAGTTGNDYLYTKNLSVGEHAITVAAIDSNGTYSSPSARAVTNVNEAGASVASTVAPPPPENNTIVATTPVDDNGLIDPATMNYSEALQKEGYELVFSDEFNAGSLNRNRWNTNLRWDGSWNGDRYEYRLVNGEAQFYVNIFSEDQEHLDKVASVYNPFQFDGNRLAIRSTRNPLQDRNTTLGYGPLSDIYTQQPFLSGAISTYDKFAQKYGYFEARIKIPAHMGTFPAFWLHHNLREWEGTQKTEIDIMENLGHAPHYVYNSFHYFTGVSEGVSGTPHFVKPLPQGQITYLSDYTTDYHVYAAEWSPGYVRFLIDGHQVSEVWNSNLNHEELYLIINMAVGGNWTNLPTNAGGSGRTGDQRFPTQNDIDTWGDPALEIDYVRVYKAR